jgi:hypothetical protein
MQQRLTDILPAGFPDHARVWVYQGSRPFSEKEEGQINEQLHQFYIQWQAHGAPVKGWAKLLFNQFVVIMADETDVNVSGCSTDSSVAIIKSMERQYKVNFFDRMTITFLLKDKTEMLPFNQVQYAIDKGYITKDTLTFNIATTKKELLETWLVPLEDSWLANRVTLPEAHEK